MDDGELFITGRKKDLLIVAGRNFHPQDIEAICNDCTGVIPGRSVAIGIEDEASGTQRIVVLAESANPTPQLSRQIRTRVLQELDSPVSEVHLVPPRWLLKTSSGKIARRPNLERFRRHQHASLLDTLTWAAAVAIALVVIITLQPNVSWGVYAGF